MKNSALKVSETAGRAGATEVLRSFIEDGGYAPGDRLPPERELMVSLGVTRSTLRNALDRLEHEGQIWRHVGKGTFIAAYSEAAGPGRLAALSRQVTPVQMMRARLSLEPAIAREAAVNAPDKAVLKIRAARDRAFNAQDWDTYEAEDDAFHRAIAEATGNVLLIELFDQLNQVRRTVSWDLIIRSSTRPPSDHASFAEHDRITEAITARNPAEAHAAMRDHLNSVAARLIGEF